MIFGLLKDRGFTHQNIDISDESFEDENFISLLEKFNFLKEYGYEFIQCKNLNDFENIINQKADEFSNCDSFKDNMLDFLNKQQKIINDIKDIYDISDTINTKEKEIKKEIKKANKGNKKLQELQKELKDLEKKQEELSKNYQNFVKSQNFEEISKLKDKKNFFKFFNDLINSAKNELERNNKHRKVYLKDIKKEIENSDNKILAWEYDEILKNLCLCDKVEGKKWNKDEFYKFVGNVANIQTRVWRRYFNFTNYKTLNFNKDKMKIYDDSKLAKHILRNFRDFRYTKEYEKKIFNEIKAIMQGLNEALKNKKDEKSFLALEFLKNTDPILTIPPYESRINKNPQICNAMSINPENITQNLKNITKKIFANADFSFLLIDENGEIKTPDFSDIKIAAKYLQRFLDISKSRLDDSDLYPRNLIQDKNFQNFKDFFELKDDEMKEFLKFTNDYYDEVGSAKKGVIKGRILKICGLHTPHKHKNKKELISALFIKNHRQISNDEFNDLCDFMQNSGEYKGEYKGARNRKIAKFFEDLDESRKTYKNAFFNEILDTFNSLKENGDKNLDTDLVKIAKDCEIIAKKNSRKY